MYIYVLEFKFSIIHREKKHNVVSITPFIIYNKVTFSTNLTD